MKRIEIFANNSVLDDLVEGLIAAIPELHYTMIPIVYGRGRQGPRLGDDTWPEENFLFVSYVEDGDFPSAKAAVANLKVRFPKEGVKMFVIDAE